MSEGESIKVVILEYYKHPLLLIHKALPPLKSPHNIRHTFWGNVPPRAYGYEDAHDLLDTYIKVLQREIESIVGKHSLMYWFHLSRRILPESIGPQKTPATRFIVRAILDAAIQKFGLYGLCPGIAYSSEIDICEVMNGLLMGSDFETERESIKRFPQFVLREFGLEELEEYYELEKLCYEVWRAGAYFRSIGKGLKLIVTNSGERYGDKRSPDEKFLLKLYDDRLSVSRTSGVAVTWYSTNSLDPPWIFLPLYNVGMLPFDRFKRFLQSVSKVSFVIDRGLITNFFWMPFQIGRYRKNHLPFARAFQEKYGVSIDAVLSVLFVLSDMFSPVWKENPLSLVSDWQYAYKVARQVTYKELLLARCESRMKWLGGEVSPVTTEEIEKAESFWTLRGEPVPKISLHPPGPHNLFIPFTDDRAIIDFAWVFQRLHYLFNSVHIDNASYKGQLFEQSVEEGITPVLPSICTARDGKQKQIDVSFGVEKVLVIGECKATSSSLAYERGDRRAINFRKEKVVIRSLEEADQKAQWLATRPIGKNYDIQRYDYILPVGISPFVEYIDSRDSWHWISEDIPRVLTPEELSEIVKDKSLVEKSLNRIVIQKQGQ